MQREGSYPAKVTEKTRKRNMAKQSGKHTCNQGPCWGPCPGKRSYRNDILSGARSEILPGVQELATDHDVVALKLLDERIRQITKRTKQNM